MNGKEYDKIADVYDKVIGDFSDTSDYLNRTLKKYFKQGKEKPALLELGCGTGNNLIALKDRFRITGIDSSAKMLSAAKKKIPGADFYIKDIRSFSFGKKFDIIFCLYDTLNHLTYFDEWKKLFRNVSGHLKYSGIFIFDINTLYKLKNFAAVSPLINKIEKNYLIADISRLSGNVFNWNLKIFKNTIRENYKLTEADIKEASFDVKIIKDELKKNFEIIRIEEESGIRADKHSERIYFICKKKVKSNISRNKINLQI